MLKDIQPSAAAEWWPPALGWWLLAGLVLILLYWLTRKAIGAWQRYRFRVQAEAIVEYIFINHAQNPRQMLAELNQLLKRWLAHLGQAGIQNLTGTEWAEFLIDSSKSPSAEEITGIKLLASGHYQKDVPDFDAQVLQAWVLRWLRSQEKLRG